MSDLTSEDVALLAVVAVAGLLSAEGYGSSGGGGCGAGTTGCWLLTTWLPLLLRAAVSALMLDTPGWREAGWACEIEGTKC